MKKFILGILVGAVLFVPTTVWASHEGHLASPKPIYRFNGDSNEVVVFDDRDNKCYISYDRYGAQSSISCVKASGEGSQ